MSAERLQTLDGWRGISITLVMLGHLFPIGPKHWALNEAVAGAGMALFFILSGYLITALLLQDDRPVPFLVKRFARVLPLAWLVLALTLTLSGVDDTRIWWRHLSFTTNWAPIALTPHTSHFWSLCLEVQFYLAIAAWVALGGRRALWALPLVATAITIGRILADKPMVIDTQYRLDEILAGCCLALARARGWGPRTVRPGLILALCPLLVASAHSDAGALNFARPYLAMLLVGGSLCLDPDHWLSRILGSRVLAYLARVSYALYLIHGVLRWTWLGTGETTAIKYLKRPLLLLATFGLAHLSTNRYEAVFIRWSRRWVSEREAGR